MFSLVFKKNNKNYTDKSEIINEYIPQDEIKNLIQEDLPFIKNENKNENKIKFKLPNLDLLKLPSKKEKDISNKTLIREMLNNLAELFILDLKNIIFEILQLFYSFF